LRLEKEGGTWLTTSMPEADSSGVQRRADLQLDDSGSLEGKVTLTFKGLSALGRRLDEYEEDDPGRKKFLEDELKSYIPASAEVELSNRPDWSASFETFVAEFKVKIPEWASAAGRRILVPASVFSGGEKHLFEGTTRVHPIYVAYPYTDVDDLTISVPVGWQVSNLPQRQHADAGACAYDLTTENKTASFHVTRRLMSGLQLVNVKYYAPLRDFFQQVRSGDEQQVVLSAASTN
jgi:hypothetical protein